MADANAPSAKEDTANKPATPAAVESATTEERDDKAEKIGHTERQAERRLKEAAQRQADNQPLTCRHRCCLKKLEGERPYSTCKETNLLAHERTESLHPISECGKKDEEGEQCERFDLLYGTRKEKREQQASKKRTGEASAASEQSKLVKSTPTTPTQSVLTSSNSSSSSFGATLLSPLHVVKLPQLPVDGCAASVMQKKAKSKSETADLLVEMTDVKRLLQIMRVLVYVVDPSQNPLVMSAANKPRHIEKLFTTPLTVHNLALVVINIPSVDQPLREGQLWNSIHHPDKVAPLTEEEFNRALTARGGLLRHCAYMQDIEQLAVWSDNNEQAIDHFLNAQLFSRHSNSLFSLIGGEHHGITTPSYYLKTNVSFYRMHYEQAYFPFFNYCFLGESVWYFILDNQRAKCNQFVVKKVCERLGKDHLSEEEEQLCALLVGTKLIMISPLEMAADGIIVHRHVQRAGEVVLGKGTCAHWGLVSGDCCVQMAVNTCGVEWLEDGLPQLVEHLKLVHQYYDRQETIKTSNTALFDLLYDSTAIRQIRHLAPSKVLLRPLLEKVLSELSKAKPHPRYSTLRDSNRTKALISEALTLLADAKLADAE